MNRIEVIRARIAANPALRPRTLEALAETRHLLEKELRYPTDLRKPAYIAWMRDHIATLTAVLA